MNTWLKRALVWNPNERVDFNISLAYFTKVVEGEVSPDFKIPENTRDTRSKTLGFGPSIFPNKNIQTPFDDPGPNFQNKLPNYISNPFVKLVENTNNNNNNNPFSQGKMQEEKNPSYHIKNSNFHFESKNPFIEQKHKDNKLKSHLNSRLNQKKIKGASKIVEMKEFGNNQYSYEVSPEDEALVNELIDDIDKDNEQVSFQDNLDIYNKNKDNIAVDLIKSYGPEIEDEILDDFDLDFDVK